MEVQRIKFRCQGCRLPISSIVLPHTPVEAKFECRRCGYESTVKTRDPVMDMIEGSIEEGEHNEKMKLRATNSRGAGRKKPGQVPAVVGGKLVYITPQKQAPVDET